MTVSLSRVARRAEARVFCVTSTFARHEAGSLRLRSGIEVTSTPRAANILLIVGQLDSGLITPALVAHDALAPPRASVLWSLGREPGLARGSFPGAVDVDDDDPVPTVRRVHEELLDGGRASEPPLLPDVEPARWRGLGPYGQGGKGMTGGVPYGRPMPERAEDRDGLKLDQLALRVGPLFGPFPPGLALDMKLQGDVIQQAAVENFADAGAWEGSIFDRALREPVPLREIEVARARSHLHWLSDAVAIAGPGALSERILRLSEHVAPGDGDAVRSLERTLRRRGFLSWSSSAVGVLDKDALQGVTGPVARASGVGVDARNGEASYQPLGFEPIVQEAGDSAARWIQRLREAAQALDLADRGRDARVGGSGVVESPRGELSHQSRPSLALTKLVPSFVVGMEWGEAVASIVSLDLDMADAYAPARLEAVS